MVFKFLRQSKWDMWKAGNLVFGQRCIMIEDECMVPLLTILFMLYGSMSTIDCVKRKP